MAVVTLSGSAAAAGSVGNPSHIDPGVPTQVGTNIGTAGSTNVPQTPAFAFQPRGDFGNRSLTVAAVGIGAVPTTFTAQMLVSADGGASWQLYGSTLPLVATTVATAQTVNNLTAGFLYAFNTSAVTLGSASGVNIVVSLS